MLPTFAQAADRVRYEAGPARRNREVPVAVVRTCPVVGEKDDQRVVERVQPLEVRDHPPDVPVQPVDHRGVDRHLQVQRVLLGGAQACPGPVAVDVAAVRTAEGVDVVLRRAQAGVRRKDPQLAHPLVAGRAHGVPALQVGTAVARDVLLARLQRIVADVVGQVQEEGLAARRRVVEKPQRVVGQDVGLVERRVRDGHVLGRDLLAVQEEGFSRAPSGGIKYSFLTG